MRLQQKFLMSGEHIFLMHEQFVAVLLGGVGSGGCCVWLLVRPIVEWTTVFVCSRTRGLSLRRWCRQSVKNLHERVAVHLSKLFFFCCFFFCPRCVFISFTKYSIHTDTQTSTHTCTIHYCKYELFFSTDIWQEKSVLHGADFLFRSLYCVTIFCRPSNCVGLPVLSLWVCLCALCSDAHTHS